MKCECGRTREYKSSYCSECAEVRRYLSMAKSEARPERIKQKKEYYKTYKSPDISLIDPFILNRTEKQKAILKN